MDPGERTVWGQFGYGKILSINSLNPVSLPEVINGDTWREALRQARVFLSGPALATASHSTSLHTLRRLADTLTRRETGLNIYRPG